MEDSRLYLSAFGNLRRKLIACLLPVAAVLTAGCSSQEGNLRLVSLDQKHSFSQTFSQAYITRNESGDADIVLVQDSVRPVHHDSSKPQPPDTSVMPRELVHIRVFWTPMNGVKADHPANTNASIHWCFVCENSNQVGAIEYCGSGLVEVNNSSGGATIKVRKAWMKERCQHGQLTDPIGPSLLYGSFRATHNDAEVKSIIAQIKSAASNTDEAQASTVSPVN
jgi:hypothetical protein